MLSVKSSLSPCKKPTQREDLDTLLNVCQLYKVISFDVFDTLLRRRCFDPAAVFSLMGNRLGCAPFQKARIEAEDKARRLNAKLFAGTREVDLNDIYAQMPTNLGVQLEVAQKTELAAEADMLYADPFLADLICRLRDLGKVVIALSDMYLSSSQVQKLLEGCGLKLDHVFTSADYKRENKGKYNTQLFTVAATKLGIETRDILHLGDHPVSDHENAMKAGCGSIFLPSLREIWRCQPQYAFLKRKKQDRSFEQGILDYLFAEYLLGGNERHRPQVSAYQEFGYCLAGPLIYVFARWLADEAGQAGIKKLILFGRDGYVIQQVLDHFSDLSFTYEVFPISRRAVIGGLACVDFDHFLESFDPRTDHTSSLSQLRELLPPSLIERFRDEHPPGKRVALRQFLTKYKRDITSHLLGEYEGLKAALHAVTESYDWEEVAFVDVGWNLTIHKGLDRILGKQVRGYYLGIQRCAYPTPLAKAFIFDLRRGRSHGVAHLLRSVELIELAFAHDTSSLCSYLKDGERVALVYQDDTQFESMRRWLIQEMRAGIDDFTKDLLRICWQDLQKDVFSKLVWQNFCSFLKRPPKAGLLFLWRVPHNRFFAANAYEMLGEYWNSYAGGLFLFYLRNGSRAFIKCVRTQGPISAFLKVYRFISGLLVRMLRYMWNLAGNKIAFLIRR